MKCWNPDRKLHKYLACCVILAVIMVLGSCGSQGKNQPDVRQGSGADAADTGQQPGAAERESYGSVLASYGISLPVSIPGI